MATALMIVSLMAFFAIQAICQMVSENAKTRAKNALDIEKERTEQKRLELEIAQAKSTSTTEV